jgi:hypothetical protein
MCDLSGVESSSGDTIFIIMQAGIVLRCQWVTEAGLFRASKDKNEWLKKYR